MVTDIKERQEVERQETEKANIDRRHISNLKWAVYLKTATAGGKDPDLVPLPLQVQAHLPHMAQATHTFGEILVE
jgi:hypothetical protein